MFQNAADVVIVQGNSDVALFAPVGTPRVSHKQVLLSIVLAVANGSDCMVQRSTAFLGINDAVRVLLERSIGSINGDTDWSSREGGLHLVNLLWSDGLEVRETDLSYELGRGARSFFAGVRILGLEHDLVGEGIVVGWGVVTAVAAIGIGITVNELLLRKLE